MLCPNGKLIDALSYDTTLKWYYMSCRHHTDSLYDDGISQWDVEILTVQSRRNGKLQDSLYSDASPQWKVRRITVQ